MARFSRRLQSRTSNPRRKTTWIGGPNTSTSAESVGAASAVMFASFDTRTVGVNPATSFTITRLVGEFIMFTDALAVEQPFGAWGAEVVNGEAFDAGVASVPTPYVESFDDRWFWHQYWGAPAIGSAAGFSVDFPHYVINSKAMRKVEFGDVIIFVVENKSAAFAASFIFNFRMLVKLH